MNAVSLTPHFSWLVIPVNSKVAGVTTLICTTAIYSSGSALTLASYKVTLLKKGGSFLTYKKMRPALIKVFEYLDPYKWGFPNNRMSLYIPDTARRLCQNIPPKIYRLPRGGDLTPYAEKVKALQSDPTVLGITFIPNRATNQLVPIYIRRNGLAPEDSLFIAFDLVNGNVIGRTETSFGGYKSFEDPSKRVNAWCIIMLDNRAPEIYKNVGTVLIKAILQTYRNMLKGGLYLYAMDVTPPFYYKLGFRVLNAEDQKKQARIAKLAESNSMELVNFKGVEMYLPEEAKTLWFQEIEQNPIDFRNNR